MRWARGGTGSEGDTPRRVRRGGVPCPVDGPTCWRCLGARRTQPMGRRTAACPALLLLIAMSLGQFTASILAEAVAQYFAPRCCHRRNGRVGHRCRPRAGRHPAQPAADDYVQPSPRMPNTPSLASPAADASRPCGPGWQPPILPDMLRPRMAYDKTGRPPQEPGIRQHRG